MTSTEAQPQTAMFGEPAPEHRWLQQFVGEWTTEAEAAEPGKPPEKMRGTETVRSIGGFWVQGEGKGQMPGGGEATMQITLGYDPQRQRFVGTWIGSMMAHLWVYEGTLDAAQRVLTLDAEGPSMTEAGKLAKYRDVVEVKSPDHRVLTSHVLGDDGQWHQFMTMHMHRRR